MNKQQKEYNDLRAKKWLYISKLRNEAYAHPDYENCMIAVDALMDFSYYESGTIIGISTTRDRFDDLYEYSDLYRGGFHEIKVGDNFVIYGFEFD